MISLLCNVCFDVPLYVFVNVYFVFVFRCALLYAFIVYMCFLYSLVLCDAVNDLPDFDLPPRQPSCPQSAPIIALRA